MKFSFRIFFILLFIFSFYTVQYAQSSIKGKVVDSNQNAIPYATVSILDQSLNLVVGSITSETGDFELEKIELGAYSVEISFLGYQTYNSAVELSSSQHSLNLKVITLKEDENMLDEVEIRAEKSQYILKMDKKVFNVGKDVLAQGGTALDILDQVPQVSVQPSGAVELRGSGAVQILINGRRSGLTMNNAIDQLEIENIDRIEVITNPSARYDASGSAGIINIILKKNKGEGLKGQVRTTIGAPANYVLLPSLSYKSAKLNLFGNLRWRYSDYNGIYTIQQENRGDNPFSLSSTEIEDRHDDGLSFFGGGDYYISDKSSATVAFFRANTKDTDYTELDYDLNNGQSNEDILRVGNSLESRNYNQLEAQFHQDFAEKGQKLNLNMQYDFWNSEKNWDLTTDAENLPLTVEQFLRTNNLASSKDLVLSADLDWPIWSGKFATGLKWENRKVDNNYLAENKSTSDWSVYKSIDNDVDYREMITAGYLDYSHTIEKLQVKLGVRGEQTNIDIDDIEAIYKDKKNYMNFFPSAFLSYPLSDALEIQTGYSRRINRPSLWDLYPFSNLTDINIVEVGNPNLNPSYTNGYEASISIRSEKMSVNPGAYYRRSTDAMETFVEQGADDFFTIIPINIDKLNEAGMELNARYRPIGLLSFNLDLNYFHFDQSGSYNERDMSTEGTSWRGRINSNLRLKNNARFMVSYSYRGGRKNAQIEYLASSDLSMSVSKSFFEDKFEVSLRASNILDTRRNMSITLDDNYTIERDSRRSGARFGVNFTYKFNYANNDKLRTQKRGNR